MSFQTKKQTQWHVNWRMNSSFDSPYQNSCFPTREAVWVNSHQGSYQFIADWKARTTPYHPQSNGLVECFNHTLLSMLATTITDYPWDWEDNLSQLLCIQHQCTFQYWLHTILFNVQPPNQTTSRFNIPTPTRTACVSYPICYTPTEHSERLLQAGLGETRTPVAETKRNLWSKSS